MDRVHMFIVTVVFGDITVKGAHTDRATAVLTTVGAALNEHTLRELDNGHFTCMPSVLSIGNEAELLSYLESMEEMDDEPWLTYEVESRESSW